MFHDLGLNPEFRRSDRRFEVNSADEARRFLQRHGVPEDSIRRVWTAIALHTTPGIPEFMEPEVALVTAGVEYDVLGIGYHDINDTDRAEITALHPRPGLQTPDPRGVHRRHSTQAGDDIRQRQGRRPGTIRARLRARQLCRHHRELRLARVGAPGASSPQPSQDLCGAGASMPKARASSTASVRRCAPSFSYRCRMCVRTVCTDSDSSPAISEAARLVGR